MRLLCLADFLALERQIFICRDMSSSKASNLMILVSMIAFTIVVACARTASSFATGGR